MRCFVTGATGYIGSRLAQKLIERGHIVDALEMAARITKIPVPRMRASPGMMRLMASVMQPVSRMIDLPEMFHPETLRVAAGVTYYGSNAKAKRELGYDPRPLDVGLREVLQYEMWMLGLRSPAL
jgi:nucleoside-diphosphate-sugar epimerase